MRRSTATALAVTLTAGTWGALGAAVPGFAGADVGAPAQTSLSLGLSPGIIDYRQPTTIKGLLVDAWGRPVAGQPVQMWVKSPGLPWRRIGTLPTDAEGRLAYHFAPDGRTAVRLVHPTTATYAPSATSGVTPRVVQVRPQVSIAGSTAARLGSIATVTGSAAPAHPGSTVVLSRLVDGAWQGLRATTLDAASRYTFPLPTSALGTTTYRVTLPPDTLHVGANSPTVTVEVYDRDLRPGDSGPAVTALQQRLTVLHYDLGAVDGRYGSETLHALTAFQKVVGLPRSGVFDGATRAALSQAKDPVLTHPTSGPSVEVDLTRQVLIYAVDGKVARILDTSTGSGQYYYSDGQQKVAVTPTGQWKIEYKVDRMVHAPLGDLYKPAYFNYSGYAIHGNGSVPPYPASHGCVRITDPAMDRFWSMLVVGMPVWVYGHQTSVAGVAAAGA